MLQAQDHIPNIMWVHMFVLGLKENLKPQKWKEKWKTLNEAIDLAIVLEDGKIFPLGGCQS